MRAGNRRTDISSLDSEDKQILEILRRDARVSVAEIGRRVGLSSAPVSRRIDRMERAGVITGYVALIDDTGAGQLEAFTEVRLSGEAETSEVERIAEGIPEIQQVFTISGDPDVLIRFRVESVDHLQRVVNAIRRSGIVAGTKTLMVLATWDRRTGE